MSVNQTLQGLRKPEEGRQRVSVVASAYRVACFVTHPIQYQAPLFRYLAADPGIDLTVFFMSSGSVDGYLDPGFKTYVKWDVPLLDGYRHVFLPGAGEQRSFWKPLVRGIRREIGAGQFDAIWVHGYAHLGLLRAILAAKTLGVKVLLRGDSQLIGNPGSPARLRIKRALLPRLFKMIDGFLAVGTRNREYYLSYGVPPERIFTMPYAVDNHFFREQAAKAASHREQLRAEMGLDSGRPIILYASKLQALKRPGDLLEAFARILSSRTISQVPYLVFIGDGDERAALESRVRQLPPGSVKFLGFRNQTELPAFFDLCDVFVLPSGRDAWGLIINEVMNAARPVIATDCCGASPDLIADGVNGFVYPAGDIEALCDRLVRVLRDPQTARRMGAESRARIARWDFAADRDGLLNALACITPPSRLST
ncbi:MAG: glycosyltransferase family 4 protein [Candidatus Binataceae bacterium]|nr:glycosyltransferase family 4 protein [Candidatus Binataceae bacterium]